jgi:hypothetical protein
MIQVWLSLGLAAGAALTQPFPVKFSQQIAGHNVSVSIDGGPVHATFAGKLGFRGRTGSWTSVCANPRAPVAMGQIFAVRRLSSRYVGGNIAGAGNIVAKYFKATQSADECAALQLAVWEAIEDGGAKPDFSSGRFRAQASDAVIELAFQAYDAIGEPGEAIFLQTEGSGQDQLSPPVN